MFAQHFTHHFFKTSPKMGIKVLMLTPLMFEVPVPTLEEVSWIPFQILPSTFAW
jgi:hypothetical protein